MLLTGNNSILSNTNNKILLIIGIILSVVLIIFFLCNLITFYQRNHGVTDPYWDYYYGVIAAVFLTAIIFIIPFKYKRVILFGWLLKIIIVFFISYFFESSYGIDGYNYHIKAQTQQYNVFIPFDATSNINTITSIFYSIFVASFRMAYLIYAFIGFLAQYIFWIAISLFLKSYKKNILMLLLFFPSLAFWSCYFGKDPITLLLISIYACGLAYFLDKKYKKAFVYILIPLVLFIYMRFWLVGIFGLSFIISVLFLKRVNSNFKKVIVVTGIAGGFLLAPVILMQFGIVDINTFIIFLSIWTRGWAMRGGSGQILQFSSPQELIFQIPWLMFTALFRPLLYEATNIFQFIAALENTLILILFIISIFIYLKNKLWRTELINIFLVHIFVWTFIYCFMSYQNLGTAVRFKLQILPFLLLFIYFSIKNKEIIYNNNLKIRNIASTDSIKNG